MSDYPRKKRTSPIGDLDEALDRYLREIEIERVKMEATLDKFITHYDHVTEKVEGAFRSYMQAVDSAKRTAKTIRQLGYALVGEAGRRGDEQINALTWSLPTELTLSRERVKRKEARRRLELLLLPQLRARFPLSGDRPSPSGASRPGRGGRHHLRRRHLPALPRPGSHRGGAMMDYCAICYEPIIFLPLVGWRHWTGQEWDHRAMVRR